MWAWVRLAAGGAVFAAAVAWASARLPRDGVPLHFDGNGLADRVGTRSEWLAVNVGLGVLLLLIGAGSILLLRHGPLGLVNVPHKDHWTAPERRDRLRCMLAADVSGLLAVTLGYLSYIPLASVLALRSDPPGVPQALLWAAVGVYLVGLGGWCGWIVRYRYRPRNDD